MPKRRTLAGRGHLSAVRHGKRAGVRTRPGVLAGDGVALLNHYTYGHAVVREGGFAATPGFTDGGTALRCAEMRHQHPILGEGIDDALQVSSIV